MNSNLCSGVMGRNGGNIASTLPTVKKRTWLNSKLHNVSSLIYKVRSGYFVELTDFVTLTPQCLGCKGSWVQIPPRRPFKSNTYPNFSASGHSRIFRISPPCVASRSGGIRGVLLTLFAFSFFGFVAQELGQLSPYFLTVFQKGKSKLSGVRSGTFKY